MHRSCLLESDHAYRPTAAATTAHPPLERRQDPTPTTDPPLPTTITLLSPTWSALTVPDMGYADTHWLSRGLPRGWYNGVYWRVVGNAGSEFVAGAVPAVAATNTYFFSTEGIRDQGQTDKRVIADVPGYGMMFCRGVGTDTDPFVACVRHWDNGTVRDPFFLQGQVGRWSQYAFGARTLTFVTPSAQAFDATRLWDQGYDSNNNLGFERGYYNGVYWRLVGDDPTRFVSGGIPTTSKSLSYFYNTYRGESNLGVDRTKRKIVNVPGYGPIFCRVKTTQNFVSCYRFDLINGEIVTSGLGDGFNRPWSSIV
ncbi:hypothetical protein HDU96_003508 [Phlyctochytrium bullatum]|nr:hypothetical protein HDU96_003508 [Phlyctochytrium bullatum]